MANPIIWPILGAQSLTRETVGDWIRANTERWNYLIPNEDMEIRALLENYLKALLGPALEGVLTRAAVE